jgi:hypothetical protein
MDELVEEQATGEGFVRGDYIFEGHGGHEGEIRQAGKTHGTQDRIERGIGDSLVLHDEQPNRFQQVGAEEGGEGR